MKNQQTPKPRTSTLGAAVILATALLIQGCGKPADGQPNNFNPVPDGQGLEPPWWEAPPGTRETEVIEVRVPADVLFAIDSATVDDNGRDILKQLVKDLQLDKAHELTVAGATDSTGTLPHNLDLSQRRAEAAVAILIECGVDPAIITIEAWADTRPIPVEQGTDTETARSIQRRIELWARTPAGTTTDPARPTQPNERSNP